MEKKTFNQLRIGAIIVADILFALLILGIYLPRLISAKDDFEVWTGIAVLLIIVPLCVLVSYKCIQKIILEGKDA